MTDLPTVKHRCPRCASAEGEVEVSPLQFPTLSVADAREAYRAEVIRALLGHMRNEHPDIEGPEDYLRHNFGWMT